VVARDTVKRNGDNGKSNRGLVVADNRRETRVGDRGFRQVLGKNVQRARRVVMLLQVVAQLVRERHCLECEKCEREQARNEPESRGRSFFESGGNHDGQASTSDEECSTVEDATAMKGYFNSRSTAISSQELNL